MQEYDYFTDNTITDLTLRILNAETLGRVSLAKKLKDELAEVKGSRTITEVCEEEKGLLQNES